MSLLKNPAAIGRETKTNGTSVRAPSSYRIVRRAARVDQIVPPTLPGASVVGVAPGDGRGRERHHEHAAATGRSNAGARKDCVPVPARVLARDERVEPVEERVAHRVTSVIALRSAACA